MATLLRTFKTVDGQTIQVEAHIVPGEREVSDVSALEKAAGTFEKAWSQLHPILSRLADQLKAASPDKIEVKFGVKLSGNLNAVVAGSAAEGNFEVSLTWERDKAPSKS